MGQMDTPADPPAPAPATACSRPDAGGGPAGAAQRSNSPSLAPPTNASHSAAVKINAGPDGFFESRTAMASWTNATSTQLSQLGPLRLLLNHCALLRSSLNPLVVISTM